MANDRDARLRHLKARAEAGRDLEHWALYVAALRAAGLKARANTAAHSAKVPAESRKKLKSLARGVTPPGVVPQAALARMQQALSAGRMIELRNLAVGAMGTFPGAPEVQNLLGLAAFLQGDPITAEIELRKAHKNDPASVDIASNLGLVLTRQGRSSDALEILEPLVASGRATSATRVNLAAAYDRSGRHEEAFRVANEVLADIPDDTDAAAIVAKSALALGQTKAAVAVLDGLDQQARRSISDIEMQVVDATSGRTSALALLDESDTWPPETVERAAVELAAWGETDAAEALVRRNLASSSESVTSWRILGLLTKWAASDPLLPALEKEVTRRDQSAGRIGSLSLVLAKALSDTGRKDKGLAMAIAAKANFADAIAYDHDAEARRLATITNAWTQNIVAKLGEDGPNEIRPIFIVGFPRSGSSLVEVILSRHPDIRPLGETPRGYTLAARLTPTKDAVHAMRRDLADFYGPQGPATRTTDKMLANARYVGPLLAVYPQARILIMRRDLRAVGLSILENFFSPADHPYSLTPRRVGQHMVNVTKVLRQWQKTFPDRVQTVSYEALVRDPDAAIPKLLAAANLEWNDSVLDERQGPNRIETLSAVQARRPITTASVARWQRHEATLAPMIDVLRAAGEIPQD